MDSAPGVLRLLHVYCKTHTIEAVVARIRTRINDLVVREPHPLNEQIPVAEVLAHCARHTNNRSDHRVYCSENCNFRMDDDRRVALLSRTDDIQRYLKTLHWIDIYQIVSIRQGCSCLGLILVTLYKLICKTLTVSESVCCVPQLSTIVRSSLQTNSPE